MESVSVYPLHRAIALTAALSASWALFATCPVCADQPLPLPAAVALAAKTKVVPALEQMGVKSVGVLKFLAVDAGGTVAKPTPRLGAINTDLAAQFQTAILLNVSRKNPIAVLRDADTVAAGIPGATHFSPEGLQKLFAAEYPVVVGSPETKVRPDAFVFGIVEVAPDLQTVEVDVRLTRNGEASFQNLCTFTARLGADNLPAAGQSFVATRGLFGGGAPSPEQAAERPFKLASLAADVRAGRRPFPLQDPEALVTLSITYDGVLQRIEARDGGAYVAEPRQRQKVVVTLKKTRKDGLRYAVALKVNGENTAERDHRPDITASKWILSDDFMTLPVRGYSVGTEERQPFVVLSEKESAKRAFDYGIDSGTITMTVFAEDTGAEDMESSPPAPADPVQLVARDAGATLDQLLLAGGVRLDPKQTFDSLDEAKGSLHTSLASGNRALIVPDGKSEAFKQRIVKFVPIPDPIMSVVVRYYTRP